MTSPLVSICIPAYKAERYLEQTLNTVRDQTYPYWEMIVVEDGSHDRTEEIVKAFAATVKQSVRFLRHEKNQGLPATRNTGIAAAHGRWLALLDSDDLWTPDHLLSVVRVANFHQADLIHGGSVLFQSETGKVLEVRAPSPAVVATFPQSLFVADYVIQPASVLLSRDLWRHVGGFDPSFRYVEDREMWLRCARAGARFAYTGKDTCLYRKHEAAMSTHAPEMAEAAAAVFEKHLDWELIPRDVRRTRTAEMWAAAGKLRQRRDPRTASQHFRRACAAQWRLGWWMRSAALAVLAAPRRFRPAQPLRSS